MSLRMNQGQTTFETINNRNLLILLIRMSHVIVVGTPQCWGVPAFVYFLTTLRPFRIYTPRVGDVVRTPVME